MRVSDVSHVRRLVIANVVSISRQLNHNRRLLRIPFQHKLFYQTSNLETFWSDNSLHWQKFMAASRNSSLCLLEQSLNQNSTPCNKCTDTNCWITRQERGHGIHPAEKRPAKKSLTLQKSKKKKKKPKGSELLNDEAADVYCGSSWLPPRLRAFCTAVDWPTDWSTTCFIGTKIELPVASVCRTANLQAAYKMKAKLAKRANVQKATSFMLPHSVSWWSSWRTCSMKLSSIAPCCVSPGNLKPTNTENAPSAS